MFSVLKVGSGILAIFLLSQIARAGSEDYCALENALDNRFPTCSYFGLPFIAPGNDTRINLFLMALDKHGVPLEEVHGDWIKSDYPYGPYINAKSDKSYEQRLEEKTLAQTRLRAAIVAVGLLENSGFSAFERFEIYRWGPCANNGVESAAEYIEALSRAENLTTEQRGVLAEARLGMAGLCEKDLEAFNLPDIDESASALDFLYYLRGAVLFYQENYGDAGAAFNALSQSQQPWVADASSYMEARSSLNLVQEAAFDGWYFDRDAVDSDEIKKTQALFRKYLENHPHGRYRASAEGLFRRIDWLKKDNASLGERYARMMQGAPVDSLVEMVSEIDLRYLSEQDISSPPAHPTFMVTQQMQAMRKSWDSRNELTLNEIRNGYSLGEELNGGFYSQSDVWADLMTIAWYLYVNNDHEKVLQLTEQDKSGGESIIAFTRSIYRGIALQRAKQWQQAEAHWRLLLSRVSDPTQKKVCELGLALALESGGRLDAMFAPGSIVEDTKFRLPVIFYTAPPEVLRQVITSSTNKIEREEALQRLLREQLARGYYREFLDDRALSEGVVDMSKDSHGFEGLLETVGNYRGYICPPTADIASGLIAEAENPRLLNCLGDALETAIHPRYFELRKPTGSALAAGKDQFPGESRSPLHIYMRVIGQESVPRDDQAYALYRAINCYNRGRNRCGNERIDQSVRKEWFITLKRQYDDTAWAKNQRYYW